MPTYKDWIQKIDIEVDYYSAFIKAWIAFNSWYRSEYSERSDRDIIEAIKLRNNHFRGYIETLLDANNTTDAATEFKSHLESLRSALVNASIVTQERGGINRQISFSEIAIVNPKTIAQGDYRVTHYRVERIGSRVTVLLHRKNDADDVFFDLEQETYDETALDVHADFKRLGTEKQGQCKAYYKEICPYVTESILEQNREGKIMFVAERAKVSRGVIEVLYLLRCSLMHGDVFPDNNSEKVYKHAYYILTAILKEMI